MKVVGPEGEREEDLDFPAVEVRPDLIRRAVLAEETWERQPKGAYRWAGMETSAEYIGRRGVYRALKNRGMARLPREKLADGRMGRVRRVPHAVGGRRAHPPKVEKVIVEKINRKEWAKALESALAATRVEEMVRARGHRFTALPPLVEGLSSFRKTSQALAFLKRLGVAEDVERAKAGRRPRRGRKSGVKTPRSLLLVVSNEGEALAFRNLPGVDVRTPTTLRVKDLAPGGHPGRLSLFTPEALRRVLEDLREVRA